MFLSKEKKHKLPLLNKKGRLLTLFFLSAISLSLCTQAQPSWLYKLPKPGNKTYLYVVESASGRTELEARNQAIIRVFQSNIMRLGYRISSSEITEAVQKGKTFEDIAILHRIPVNKVCEYTERMAQGYRCCLLCQVARTADVKPRWNDFTKCLKIKKKRSMTGVSSVEITETNNYVVLPLSKLMVQTTDLGSFNWRDAKAACKASTEGNYTDWRLPKKKELMTLYVHRKIIKLNDDQSYFSSSKCGANVYYLAQWRGNPSIEKEHKRHVKYVRAVRTIK